MKPILIHNYDKVLQGKKDEFMELFLVDGEDWEEAYAKSGEVGVIDQIAEASQSRRITRANARASIYQRITQQAKRTSSINNMFGQANMSSLKSPFT